MNKIDVVNLILKDQAQKPQSTPVRVFAPTNIALSKYWGKRDEALHLPMNSSVSISLGDRGCTTTMSISRQAHDEITLHNEVLSQDNPFAKKASEFLDLFRTENNFHFNIDTKSNIPIAAGLASSACGYAALVKGLSDLFCWELSKEQLSILARLGSGSASRSLWDGFVVWHKGARDDGMDSFAEPLPVAWPEFCVGLVMVSAEKKPISSRAGMLRTVETSSLYAVWPDKAEADCSAMIAAIHDKDFTTLGAFAEQNALFMHATMHAASPAINYWQNESIRAMKKVWALRREGLSVYFTMDAGPNIKLLFLENERQSVEEFFNVKDVISYTQ
jgi:diphosphomevalonate decarboxylase